ncbi:MAG: hypothetical protein ABI664_02810 [bacterium]
MSVSSTARESTVRYLWFWKFWHWSRESYRSGTVLRDPVHGIGGHWDEWFHHEATDEERKAVEQSGETVTGQRQFVMWLVRYWSREADNRNPPSIRFVLGQLALVPPFDGWRAFNRYRASYGSPGISAIVIAEDSRGEAADVRRIEALTLCAEPDAGAPTIVPEGFHADAGDLRIARTAAKSALGGRGLLRFLATWVATGRRSYPRWLDASLTAGWLIVTVTIVYLLIGPDPGERLIPMTIGLLALWLGLMSTAVGAAAWVSIRAWRQAREWSARLKNGQIRLRMNSGLTLKGASAGLPFSLNVLLSLYRSRPRAEPNSWLWQRVFRAVSNDPDTWAATGAVTADGDIEPVVLERKLRASLHHPSLRNILAPRQHDASARVVDQLMHPVDAPEATPVAKIDATVGVRFGHAHGSPRLRVYQCSTMTQALMRIGDVRSNGQVATNLLAVVASAVMLAAMPSVGSILLPPTAPWVTPQPSTSPYSVWLGVESSMPDAFYVVLESNFWANRRAPVQRHPGADGSVRAEIALRRLSRHQSNDEEDGIFWLERRRYFLTRVFDPGERIGRYSFSYLTRARHD